MFYDEQGKHVRTKKEVLDENGLYFATKKIGKNNLKAEQTAQRKDRGAR